MLSRKALYELGLQAGSKETLLCAPLQSPRETRKDEGWRIKWEWVRESSEHFLRAEISNLDCTVGSHTQQLSKVPRTKPELRPHRSCLIGLGCGSDSTIFAAFFQVIPLCTQVEKHGPRQPGSFGMVLGPEVARSDSF